MSVLILMNVYLSRAEHAEDAELLTMWLSPMNACSYAMPFISRRAHRGRRAANYVVVIDECVLIRNALYLAQGTQRARRPVGASFVGVSLHGTLSLCRSGCYSSGCHCMAPCLCVGRGVIRRGVIFGTLSLCRSGCHSSGCHFMAPCLCDIPLH